MMKFSGLLAGFIFFALGSVFTLEINANDLKVKENTDQELVFEIPEVHTEELKAWFDEGRSMIILDARSKKYDNGQRIPTALSVPYNSPLEVIEEAIPSNDSLVVVYCSNIHCPASVWLAKRLYKLGYTQVYEYTEGIKEWVNAGNPVEYAN